MKRTLIAVLLSLGIASMASAASLSLNVSGGNTPGSTVTVDIVADVATGDPNVLGLDLRLTAGGGINWTGATQTALSSFGSLPWTTFATICSGADPCVAVNQGNPVLPAGAAADPFNGVIASATGVAGPAGMYTIELTAVGESFFGVDGAAPVAFNVVPEPTTAALLGLGLLGLGVTGRRR